MLYVKCPQCEEATRVVDTRVTTENEVRRRRECGDCKDRFTTYERLESPALAVEKEDGEVEQFSREKLKAGIAKACNKRPVENDTIEDLVDQVESQIRSLDTTTITTEKIGELVMERLRELDEVAYIRFASVYRSFDDVDSFEEELEELKNQVESA